MIKMAESISHDHDYCASNAQDEKDIDFVVENVLNSSSAKCLGEEIKDGESLHLSPAYSCDSGIDYFANDLVNNFGGEGDDLFNFLLDDDFELDTLPKERTDFTKSLNNSSVKMDTKPTVDIEKGKAVVAKKTAAANNDEFERSKKNAENARENRRKKKLYVEGLEKEVGQLRNENIVLVEESNKLEKKVGDLQSEVDYLKSILANESMLSKLIESVSMTPGVSLSTSFCSSRKPSICNNDVECEKENVVSTRSASRKRAGDSQPAASTKRSRSVASSSGGVCLHVKQSKVSLEFCGHCSKMAED